MLAAAANGKGGEAYFLTDGPPVEFKAFMTALMATRGVDVTAVRSMPHGVAVAVACVGDAVWRGLRLSGTPPLPRIVVRLFGAEVTVSDAKARRELGYANVISREDGLAEMMVGTRG